MVRSVGLVLQFQDSEVILTRSRWSDWGKQWLVGVAGGLACSVRQALEKQAVGKTL
jgi:hypothetical protein